MKSPESKKPSRKASAEAACCFFCAMEEVDQLHRTRKLKKCFREIPLRDEEENVLALNALWRIAMSEPDHAEFPSLGIFECMGKLVHRGVTQKQWLLRNQNIYIPYYATHIIGSYTMNEPQFAEMAVKSGVVRPLMELLRGKISWVEQRVGFRALGHLASHEKTLDAIAEHEGELIELAMAVSCSCLNNVYDNFISVEESRRLKYHCDLLTRGIGGSEMENKKAEEWGRQLQQWSLYLLNCFACKERALTLSLICNNTSFLKKLCEMSGRGVELIRTLCNFQKGRKALAHVGTVIKTLCNTARSSDESQYMAIESILLILKDPETRYVNGAFETAILPLADLVELESGNDGDRQKVGDAITRTLLQDYHKIKYGILKLKSRRRGRALEKIWDAKVERKRREKLLGEEKVRERQEMVGRMKQEGKQMFQRGEMEKAVEKYSEALNLCKLKMRKERMVLHSNRAQCYLLMKNADAAISDTTRALCLSSSEGKAHGKSLWRRSQAYEMKGMAKESLMDCLRFVRECKRGKGVSMPYYAAQMIEKQMKATWIFASAKAEACKQKEEDGDLVGEESVTP